MVTPFGQSFSFFYIAINLKLCLIWVDIICSSPKSAAYALYFDVPHEEHECRGGGGVFARWWKRIWWGVWQDKRRQSQRTELEGHA
uniref:HDC06790 n=1 Tax=Drosophila melanogaster TaxID=7227 RepID=Q6IGA9_DROME|nr:TPA_inf: HDC06790 [Drosophila melanogaster]